ncbi:hypothetical protein ETB97_001292 [Aspergillus alliaceus]|uniref:Uncharacterized protein n=1 Tax=Petromyces alliaceus TaxID=209559 RepID=A0A8H6A5S5_PETAA|nr:hypothetical protein ETB97_001292 [Aspergillus burnettii]
MATPANSEAKADVFLGVARELQLHLKDNTPESLSVTSDVLHALYEDPSCLPPVTDSSIRRQMAAHGAELWNISFQKILADESNTLSKGMTLDTFVYK